MIEKKEHHIDEVEMKQLQDFAHLLWLGNGNKIDLTVVSYKRDKKHKVFNTREKLKMLELHEEEKLTMEDLSKIFKIHPSSVSKFIREVKNNKK